MPKFVISNNDTVRFYLEEGEFGEIILHAENDDTDFTVLDISTDGLLNLHTGLQGSNLGLDLDEQGAIILAQ